MRKLDVCPDFIQLLFADTHPYALFYKIRSQEKLETSNFYLLFSNQEPIDLKTSLNKDIPCFGYIPFENDQEVFYPIDMNSSFELDLTHIDLSSFRKPTEKKILSNKNEDQSFQSWEDMINQSKTFFENSKTLKKIVLHRTISYHLKDNVDVNILYDLLPTINSFHHFIIFKREDIITISYSPETLINYENGSLKTMALAGTFSKLEDPELNIALEHNLLNDPKNLREHQFVVEKIKNTLSKYSTRILSSQLYVQKLQYIQHLCMNITAELDIEKLYNVIKELNPTPALGGEPKNEAFKVIRKIEGNRRNLYGGIIGIHLNSLTHFSVAIRSFDIDFKNNKLTLFGGCGILPESNATDEWVESENKMYQFSNYFKNHLEFIPRDTHE